MGKRYSMDNKMLEIFNHFGYRNQLKKLSEECFEFIESVYDFENVLKYELDNDKETFVKCKSHLTEELADMMLLLGEFNAKYGIDSDEFDAVFDTKVERTLDRIENGYYDEK